MRDRTRSVVIVALAAMSVGIPAAAYANAGLPMLAVVWPLSWAALIPVIAIETAVGRRVADISWGRSLLGTALANAVSTLVGIPLTWGVLLAIQMVVPGGGGAELGIGTLGGKLFAVTLQAPWLIPYDTDLYWMVPAAVLFMLPFFGVVSVFVERPLFRLVAKCDALVARSWSWRANLTTYGILIAAVAAWLVVSLVIGPR
jgi:hypothetical protein